MQRTSLFEKRVLSVFGIFAMLGALSMAGTFASSVQGTVVKSSNSEPRMAQVQNLLANAFTSQTTYKKQFKKQAMAGVIIPHDERVSSVRQDFFNQLKETVLPPSTVVLIAPNHLAVGTADLQTAVHDWTVPSGQILADKKVIGATIDAGAALAPLNISNEYGITTVLDDIARTFPDAKIAPLIIKRGTAEGVLQTLMQKLADSCDDCMLILSADMSHGQPALLANLHDSLTIRALQEGDAQTLLYSTEVDSPEGLWLLSEWSHMQRADHFQVLSHTNSGEIAGDSDVGTITHIIGGYVQGKNTVPEDSITFSLAGDFMFARGVHRKFNAAPLESLVHIGERFFSGVDASIVNLEGAISKSDTVPIAESMSFSFIFPRKAVDMLGAYNINTVSLANNHSLNNDWSGLRETQALLSDSSIESFGGPTADYAPSISKISRGRINLIMIGVHATESISSITGLIEQYKINANNKVLVYAHWGTEYDLKHSLAQQNMAHDWVDAGADLVVGAHPHVVQDTEVYKGVPIVYSLGNFLFDQTEENTSEKGVQDGMTLHGQFTQDALTLFALPIRLEGYQPSVVTESKAKEQILQQFYLPWQTYKNTISAGETYTF